MISMAPNQTALKQQLALVTYKSKQPDELSALKEAQAILGELEPMHFNDAETLGLWGAMHKRLFDITKQRADLDTAILSYEKGYRLLSDYYNGINLAFLLTLRASLAKDKEEALADSLLARSTWEDILKITEAKFAELAVNKDVENNDDRYWVLATKAEAWVGLDNEAEARKCLQQAEAFAAESWMVEATQEQLHKLRQLLKNSPL